MKKCLESICGLLLVAALSWPVMAAPASGVSSAASLIYTQHADDARKLATGPDAHVVTALLQYEAGWCQGKVNTDSVRQELQAANSNDPFVAGVLSYVDSNYSTALEHFQAASKAEPSACVDLWMGRTLAALYRDDEAGVALKRAQTAWGDKSATVSFLQAQCAVTSNHEALPLLNHALQLNPDMVPARMLSIRLRSEAGDPDSAIAEAQKALATGAPANPLALEIAVMQRVANHLDDAQKTLDQARKDGADPHFVAQVALESAMVTELQTHAPDYAGLDGMAGAVPEAQRPKLQVIQGLGALSRSDYQTAQDDLRLGSSYAEADGADVYVLMYVGLARIKMAEADPQKLGHDRLQAITLYAKAWQNVARNSPMQTTIQDAFLVAKSSEIAAIKQAIDNNLAVVSQIGNRNSADRLKQELEERLAQAEQLQLGTPGTLRGDQRQAEDAHR